MLYAHGHGRIFLVGFRHDVMHTAQDILKVRGCQLTPVGNQPSLHESRDEGDDVWMAAEAKAVDLKLRSFKQDL